MKLRDFLTLKSGSGILLSGNVYNPYINYSWSQTLTVGGKQQIKDTGTAGLLLKLTLTRKDCTKSIESIKVEDTTSKVYY